MSYDHVYDELIGYRSRNEPCPPPEFPLHCPKCGTRLRFALKRNPREAVYGCGGSYSEKPQIQNHTDYFWGRCPKAELAAKVKLPADTPDSVLDDALQDAGIEPPQSLQSIVRKTKKTR